jgi:hypothetical protein
VSAWTWPVSARFLETVAGSHRAVARVRLCTQVPQYGANPVGQVVPLLAGSSVHLDGSADVKAQLRITVPGDWWDEVQPLGAEFFVERGVSFGDGTEEYVPLGYFALEDPDQPNAPYGPITLDCDDRTARFQSNRIILPWQIPAGTTHRAILERLVNGSADGIGGWGMYRLQGGAPVPIIWTDAGYDPDAAKVDGLPLIDDSTYDYAAKLVGAHGATLRFRPTGELEVVAADPPIDAPAVYALRSGRGGTLKRWARKTSSRGYVNTVRAVGSGTAQTGYRVARITDGPLRYNGPIGPRTKYYASPLLSNDQEADAAASTVLAKSTGLPTETRLWTVPNPALRPLMVVSGPTGTGFGTYVLDDLDVPLVGGGETALVTRTLNPVVEVETPETPEPTPDPPAGPGGGNPDPGGGPTPGGGDPTDGTQVALLRGWGVVIDGDECNGSTISSKWGLYNGAGHSGNGLRRASAYSMVPAEGLMRCHGDPGGTTGGAAFKFGSYGYRVEVRARAYRSGGGGGSDYHFVLILWPDSDQWPAGAEYDFWEGDVNESGADIFMHLPNHTPYRQDHATLNFNPADWHNYACEWDPRAQTLTQYVDGVQQYRGTGRVAQAPGPMHLTYQLDNFGGSNHYAANMDVKWVRIYQKPNA